MSKRKRFLISAVLFFVFAAGLCGCNGTDEKEQNTEQQTSAEPTAAGCAVYEGYTIIRPELATEKEVELAVELRELLLEYGCKTALATDWVGRGEKIPDDAAELLIGRTNRPAAVALQGELRYDEYTVAKDGKRVILAGGSDMATEAAVKWFIGSVLSYEGEGFSAAGDVYHFRKSYRLEQPEIAGRPLAEYSLCYSEDANGEYSCAEALQAGLLADTGYLLPVRKMSPSASADAEPRIVFKVDPDMKEGFQVNMKNEELTVRGSDRTQLRAAVDALQKEVDASETLALEQVLPLEGFVETVPVQFYLSAGAASGGDGSEEKPFASVRELLSGLRDRAKQGPCDFTVILSAGEYLLDETILLNTENFGLYTSSLHFVCRDEAPARICAWVPVTGFEETTVNGVRAWAAPLPSVRGDLLYPNQCFSAEGTRLDRPRYPETGYLTAQVPGYETPAMAELREPMNVLLYSDDAVEHFTRLEDIQVRMFHYWLDERLSLAERNPADRTLKTAGMSSIAFREYDQGAPYYFENVYEALHHPGEYYADRESGRLLYIPKEGETIEGFTLYASDLETMLVIDGLHGSAQRPAVSFENLAFAGSDWKSVTRKTSQGASDIGGTIRINDASYVHFQDCTFEHIGNYAVEVQQAVSHLTIDHCTMTDLGAGGVTIYGQNTADTEHPHAMHDIRITDCLIRAYGRVHTNAIGVILRYAYDCEISHNEICDGYYSGISVGWIWGYAEHLTRRILVEKNHIYQIGQGMLSDMGCIYTLGVQPGTVLRGNLVHDVQSRTSKGWGLYTDEGSSDILIEDNISYRVCSEAFHQHYGRENIVRNNILACGGDAIVMSSRKEEHAAFLLEGNILLSNGVPIYGQVPEHMHIRDNNNLVWNLKGDITNAGGLSAEDMQRYGLFQNAKIADPCFADPLNGDFTLPADSPAFAIGFRPIDMSDVGIRPR